MKKRIAFVLVAGLMVVGYLLVQPESEPAEPTMAEVWARTCGCEPGHTDGTVLLPDAGRPSFRTMD